MADDTIAAVGTMIGAFMGGAGLAYQVGCHVEQNKWKPLLERERERITEHLASIRTLNNALEDTRARLRDLEINRVPPPPTEQANQLVQTLLRDDTDVWLSCPPQKPRDHDETIRTLRTKIISIANLKGGVGKTTTTANLAAYFNKKGLRVLAIDADYQGSLSAIFKSMAGTDEAPARTAHWLNRIENVRNAVEGANRINDAMHLTRYLSAFYELTTVETRLMIEWLLAKMLQDNTADDLRYRLSKILHSAECVGRFDVILIDCPPRLSTATINALCASTHLLIPTVPDQGSLEAVANFIRLSRTLTAQLNPNIRLAGVAPVLTLGTDLKDDEKARLGKLVDRVRQYGEEPYILKTNIPRNTPIANIAGTGIAVLKGSTSIRRLFERFCAEIEGQSGPVQIWKLKLKHWLLSDDADFATSFDTSKLGGLRNADRRRAY